MTRVLIDEITIAHAYHQAQSRGDPLDSLARPHGVGYGIGVAVGLFGMLTAASLLVYQALQIGSVIGFMMRSAVSEELVHAALSADIS